MTETLYVVSTPIGNLQDITLRALHILREVSLIAAEDTRVTRKLLTHFDIHTPLVSYNEHNAARRTPELLAKLADADVALVTDAGTPGVSDPGAWLVDAASRAGVRVVPVPGASAATAALAASGLSAEQWRFSGFPPRSRRERLTAFQALAGAADALILYEAPHRLKATLQDLRDTFGAERRLAVCRELTKLHEEIFRGTVEEAIACFTEPRGEFTLVLEGIPSQASETPPDMNAAREELGRLKALGVRRQDAMAVVMRSHGIPRREAYRLWEEA